MGIVIPLKAVNKLFKKHGNGSGEPNVRIYFARQCSCIANNGGRYDPSCKDCIYGFIYEDKATDDLMIRTSMSLKFMTNEQAAIFTGGCYLTVRKVDFDGKEVPAYSRLTDGDVIVVKNDFKRSREICELNIKDYLFAFNVKQVLSVSQKKKVFKENIDYKVIYKEDKTAIEWIGEKPGNNGQNVRQYYSVEYLAEINYMVWNDQLKTRGALDSNLPKKIACVLRPYFEEDFNSLVEFNTNFSNPSDVLIGK